jgi:hypothetical protein
VGEQFLDAVGQRRRNDVVGVTKGTRGGSAQGTLRAHERRSSVAV